MISDDSDDFESNGLRIGLRFNIIEDVLKGQFGATIAYAEYNSIIDPGGPNPISYSVKEPNYLFDFGVIVDIMMFDVLFSVGYNANDMITVPDNANPLSLAQDILKGPYFTIGLEIFPWD